MKKIRCKRCGNSDPNLFYLHKGKQVCRACIKYHGRLANIKKYIKPKYVHCSLNYSLSKQQILASENICNSKEDVYVDAVCGSGKTEICFRPIEEAIAEGKRVGFAIPRREVVKEIFERLKVVFPTLNIVCVYGGNSDYLDGDIVCLTCHQCYRYYQKFGLLIIDEYDAFPLKNDDTLLGLVRASCYGKTIYLSATFSNSDLENKYSVSLNRRYHNYDMVVPIVSEASSLRQFFILLNFLRRFTSTTFIYCPTIKCCKFINILLHILNIKSCVFTSTTDNKDDLYKDIKNGKWKVVVCSTILERGITLRNINVIVFSADHPIFDAPTLIQISGRVGRKKDCPDGEILFLTKHYNESIKDCINNIVNKNNGIK